MEDENLLNLKNLVGVSAGATLAGLGAMFFACLLGWMGVDIPRLPLLPLNLSGATYGLLRVLLPALVGTITYVCAFALFWRMQSRKMIHWGPDVAAIGVAIVFGAFVW